MLSLGVGTFHWMFSKYVYKSNFRKKNNRPFFESHIYGSYGNERSSSTSPCTDKYFPRSGGVWGEDWETGDEGGGAEQG